CRGELGLSLQILVAFGRFFHTLRRRPLTRLKRFLFLKLYAGRGCPVSRLALGRGGETVRAALGKHAAIAVVACAASLLLGCGFIRIAQWWFGCSCGARRLALRFA